MAWKDERGYPTPGEMMDEAAQEIERLSEKVASLTTCEAWLQKQVADLQFAMRWNEERFQEKDAELAELRKTAAALMEIAASGADATTRRRMLDRMAMESFAENG
jgi:type II secretory pathway component PulM